MSSVSLFVLSMFLLTAVLVLRVKQLNLMLGYTFSEDVFVSVSVNLSTKIQRLSYQLKKKLIVIIMIKPLILKVSKLSSDVVTELLTTTLYEPASVF